jgi:hypothetical protein
MSEVVFRVNFQPVTCCECGMTFAMPARYYQERRRDHRSFCCPAGHGQHFPGESTEERLRRERAFFRQDADSVREQRDRLEHRLRAQKAATTRIRNRVGRGVCPCCNRTFRDLADHMATKHPEYADAS